MSEVVNLFHEAAFDPETVIKLCSAYDRAMKAIDDDRLPHSVHEVVVLRIISLAKEGERDPDRLSVGALKGLRNVPKEY